MKNKRIDHISNIMSKHYDIFTENLIIFFSNATLTGNMTNCRIPYFGDYVNVIIIS